MKNKELAAKRRLMKLLRESETIDCLDLRSYLTILSLKIEMQGKNLNQKLATLVKQF